MLRTQHTHANNHAANKTSQNDVYNELGVAKKPSRNYSLFAVNETAAESDSPMNLSHLTTDTLCAACGVRHQNTAICDGCAPRINIAGEHTQSCGCDHCGVARRAELALVSTDVDVYALPEVRAAVICEACEMQPAAVEGLCTGCNAELAAHYDATARCYSDDEGAALFAGHDVSDSLRYLD